MKADAVKPQVISEGDVAMVGPGYDDAHYVSVPIKSLYEVEGVGDLGVCFMEPGDETRVFALEEEDDGTAHHQYGPCDEWYYILEGQFTVWWGKNAANLENSYVLEKGDCAYYPTDWKYKVRNTGDLSVRDASPRVISRNARGGPPAPRAEQVSGPLPVQTGRAGRHRVGRPAG